MFQYCKNNSDLHEDTKFKVFKELVKNGYEVYTEVEFIEKGRADVVAITQNGEGYIFEIVNTEKEDSKKNKLIIYPIEFDLFFIECDKPLEMPI
jgi:hypothetical protein